MAPPAAAVRREEVDRDEVWELDRQGVGVIDKEEQVKEVTGW